LFPTDIGRGFEVKVTARISFELSQLGQYILNFDFSFKIADLLREAGLRRKPAFQKPIAKRASGDSYHPSLSDEDLTEPSAEERGVYQLLSFSLEG